MAPTSVELAAGLGQHDVVPFATTDPKGLMGVLLALPLCYSSNISPRCSLRIMPVCPGSSAVDLSFSGSSLPPIFVCWCLLWCLLSAFRIQYGSHFHQWGLNHLGLHIHNTSEYAHGKYMCLLVLSLVHTTVALSNCSLQCFE